MSKINLYIMVSIACLVPINTFAAEPEWTFFAEITEYKIYYAPTTITCVSNMRSEVWLKYVKKTINTVSKKIRNKKSLAYAINKYVYDCYNKTYKLVTVAEYTVKGDVIKSIDINYPETNTIVPGSVSDDMYDIICEICKENK